MSSVATSLSWEPDGLTALTAAVDQIDEEQRRDLTRYMYDPVGFARDCIDWTGTDGLTPYQEDVLHRLVKRRRVAVRGPHGLGKTTENAVAVLWFAVTRSAARIDWKVITTAGAWRQLEKYLWPEIHKWARRLRWDVLGLRPWRDKVELLDLSLKLPAGEAFAVASDDAALIEGAHADSVLYIYDESKAISGDTFDASEGAFSGARPTGLPEAFALAQSTPGAPLGRFYDIHARRPGFEDWDTRHVTVDEAMAAGRISSDWLEARRRQWGVDSALFANRALGEFHADDEDGVIPLAWLEAAHVRWDAWEDAGRPEQPGRRMLGVDVADGGADRTAFAVRQGDVIFEVVTMNTSTMETAGLALARLHLHAHSVAIVDNIGVGSGVLSRLRESSIGAVPFTASARSGRRDVTGEFGFANLRSAAWWNLREMLDPALYPTLAIPRNDELDGDLTAPKWRVLSGAKIQVEAKADIKKRIGRSPDLGDAVMQVCYLTGGLSGQLPDAVSYDRPGKSELAAVPYFDDEPWKGDGPPDAYPAAI
jgi:hypothetical protein